LATLLATFSKNWMTFSDYLVTLLHSAKNSKVDRAGLILKRPNRTPRALTVCQHGPGNTNRGGRICTVDLLVPTCLEMSYHSEEVSCTEAGLLKKSSCLASAVGVTKFTIVTDMILVTLCSPTKMFNQPTSEPSPSDCIPIMGL
jgi:hypothetical protein